MKAPFFPFNSLHKKHPFPVIYWVVPYFWDTYDSQKPWCQAMLKWLTPGELDARCNRRICWARIGFLLESWLFPRIFCKVTSRSTWTSQVTRAPGQPKWIGPVGFPTWKTIENLKKWPEFQRRSFLWDFIDVVSSRQSTTMLVWQAAKNNEASVHHLSFGLRFLHKQPLTLKHVACQGDNCLQNKQFSKNH